MYTDIDIDINIDIDTNIDIDIEIYGLFVILMTFKWS